jgi:hypothetical protein
MTQKHKKPPPKDHSHAYEVVPGLYISGHPDHAKDFLKDEVHAVVDLEGEIDTSAPQGEDPRGTTLYLYWPFEDGPLPDEDIIRDISTMLARYVADDHKVLVHCRSGHNRSGLICARTMIAMGKSADEAIQIVREKRGDGHALENERFVEWLRGEKPPN